VTQTTTKSTSKSYSSNASIECNSNPLNNSSYLAR